MTKAFQIFPLLIFGFYLGCDKPENKIVAREEVVYYGGGQIKSRSTLEGNTLHGEFIEYYPNGNIKVSGEYNQGSKIGPWISTNDGKGKIIDHYDENGFLYITEVFDKSNNKLDCIGYPSMPNNDTIQLGETYNATYRFHFKLNGKVSILIGKFDESETKLEEIYEKLESIDEAYKYSFKPDSLGLHTLDGVVLNLNQEMDTIRVNGVGFTDSFYVSE